MPGDNGNAGRPMDRDTIIQRLREHEPELKAAGVVHLHLFGSIVRGDARPDSDVDLAAQFDRAKTRSLFDVVRIQNKLTDILGIPADLADAERLKDYVRVQFEREAELVF